MFLAVSLLLLLKLCGALSLDCQVSAELISALTIEQYRGCNTVEGNVIINQSTFTISGPATAPLSEHQLSTLLSVTEITGYLLIHNLNTTNITNLRFLRNLKKINGQETLNPRPNQKFALVIEDNEYLETLGLSSLDLIANGGIRINNNPSLCLVDTIDFGDYLSPGALERIGGLSTDCNAAAVDCHTQCSRSKGCWGVLPDECEECANYEYQGNCVPSCDTAISYADNSTNSTKQCIPLSIATTELFSTSTTQSTHQHTPTTSQTDQTPTATSDGSTTGFTTVYSTSTTSGPQSNWVIVIVPSFAPLFLLLVVVSIAACICFRQLQKKITAKKDIKIGEGVNKDGYIPMVSLGEMTPRKRSSALKRFQENSPELPREDETYKRSTGDFIPSSNPQYSRPDPWGYVKIEPPSTTNNSSKTSGDRHSMNSTDLSDSPQSIHKTNVPQPVVPGGVYSTHSNTNSRLTPQRTSLSSIVGLSSRSSSMPSRSSLLTARTKTSAMNSDYSLNERQGNFNE